MAAEYDIFALREQALLQLKVGRSVAVPPREMLALLKDLDRCRDILERIVGWDYPCRDDDCGAGDVAAKAFEEN